MQSAISVGPFCQTQLYPHFLRTSSTPKGFYNKGWGRRLAAHRRLCCMTRTGLTRRIRRVGFFKVATTTRNHPRRYPGRSLFRRMWISPELPQKTFQQQALKSIRVRNHCDLSLRPSSRQRSVDAAIAAIQSLRHRGHHADSMIQRNQFLNGRQLTCAFN